MLPCSSSWLGCMQVAGARGLLFRHQALGSWEGCCHLAPVRGCSSLLWIRLSSNEPKRGLNQHVRESLRMFCFLLASQALCTPCHWLSPGGGGDAVGLWSSSGRKGAHGPTSATPQGHGAHRDTSWWWRISLSASPWSHCYVLDVIGHIAA